MFGLLKLLLLTLWLIGLSQGRVRTGRDWREFPDPDPTIFENKKLYERERLLNDVDHDLVYNM